LTAPGELAPALQALAPHLVIVVGWYWLLSPALLRQVPGGVYGVHASLLPRYRGNAPLVWAILRGERETGVSLFRFDDGMDTGDLAAQAAFPIGPEETIAEVLAKAEDATVAIVAEQARPLLEGTMTLRAQDHALASYCSLRQPCDGRIDWRQPAPRLYNFIRAQTRPYPGAFTHLPDGRTVTIWAARLFPYPYYGIPGLVGQQEADGVVVACGDGALVVTDYTVEGEPTYAGKPPLRWGVRLEEPR
ncbi:MAG TPA: methionyl-tRNA formyltransferase, partial [Armatimonadota bacterium]|nr:methionyl-tRNA formyltransferase [Armatimonadota bacterium]